MEAGGQHKVYVASSMRGNGNWVSEQRTGSGLLIDPKGFGNVWSVIKLGLLIVSARCSGYGTESGIGEL